MEPWVLAEVTDSEKKRERERAKREEEEQHRPALACGEGTAREEWDGQTDRKSPGRETHRSAGLEPPGTGCKEEAEKRGWRRRVEEEEREGGQVGVGGGQSWLNPQCPVSPMETGSRGGHGGGGAMRAPGWVFRAASWGEAGSRVLLWHSHPPPCPMSSCPAFPCHGTAASVPSRDQPRSTTPGKVLKDGAKPKPSGVKIAENGASSLTR